MATARPRRSTAWLADEFTAAVLSRFAGDRSLSLRRARRRDLNQGESIAWGRRKAARQARRSDRAYYAWFDSSDVAAVQAARLNTAETAAKWQTMGVPLNQIIRATDATPAVMPPTGHRHPTRGQRRFRPGLDAM